MKKILILHGENTYNYGTFMMLINFIYYSAQKNGYDYNYIVRMNTLDDYNRLLSELSDNKIKVDCLLVKNKSGTKNLFCILNGLKYKFFDQLNEYKNLNLDKIVILGGDDLSEYYKGWTIFTDLLLIKLMSRITSLYLIGQTIGPFYSWRRWFAKFCFKNSVIIARDPNTIKYLQQDLKYNYANLFLSSDLALLDLPLQSVNFFAPGMDDHQYITLVPSGLWSKYSSDVHSYVESWVDLINKMLAIQEINECKILVLPHVLVPSKSDDRHIINLIQEAFRCNPRVTFYTDKILPSQARSIFAKGLLTVTGRMHPAISSLQSGVPALSLSYSVKYSGIIGADLGLHDLVIEYKDYKCSDRNELIISKIKMLVNNRSEIVRDIKVKLDVAKQKAIDMFSL